MSADTLDVARKLRYMSLLESAATVHASGDLDRDDPATRLEHVRLLRDAGEFSRALAVLGPATDDEPDALVAERISALNRRCDTGDEAEAGGLVARAESDLLKRGPGARYLVVSVARWRASHGHVRDGLRLLHEHADTVGADSHPLERSATLFATRTLLLLRLGWHPAIRRAVAAAEEHGFLDMGPHDAYDSERAHGTIRRLVTAGRMLARIGDVRSALELLARAETAAQLMHSHEHVWLPAPRRWHAHVMLLNGRPDQARRLLRHSDGDTTEPATDLSCPLFANPMILLEKALVLASRYDGTSSRPLDEALACLDIAEQRGGWCPELRWTRARLLRRKGSHEQQPGSIDNAALTQLKAIATEGSPDAFARLELGQSLVDKGAHDRACKEFEEILRTNGNHREVLLAQAITTAEMSTPGDESSPLTRVADTLCEKLVDDTSILAIAAERFAQRGHYAQAERIFAHTNRTNPAHGLSWAGRIRAQAWKRDFGTTNAVIEELREAADRQSRRDLDRDEPTEIPYVRISLATAMVHGDQLRYAEASREFDKAHEVWLADRRIYGGGVEDVGDLVAVWRATGLRWQSKHDEAISLLETARQDNPYAAAVLEELGWAHLEIDRPAAALSYFERAKDLEPERSGAWRGHIQSLRQARDFETGIQIARQARKVLPRDVNILCELAWLYGESNRTAEAIAVLDTAMGVDATSPHVLAWHIIYLTRERRFAEAIALGDRARSIRPESSEVLDALCYAHMRSGHPGQARQLVTAALDSSEPDLAILMLAASIYAQAGAPAKRWHALAKALVSRTNVPQAVRTGLSLYRFYSDLNAAVKALKACPSEVVESDAGLLWERIELSVLNQEFAQADADMIRARTLFPHSRSMVRRQAMVYTFQERFDEAIALLKREIAHREINWDLKATLAEVYVEAGHPGPALEICKTFRDDKPIRVSVVEVRAVRATGGVDEGLRLARRLQAKHPNSRRVNLALARSLEDVHNGPEGLLLLKNRMNEFPLFPPIPETISLLHRIGRQYEAAEQVIEGTLARYSPRSGADAGLLAEKGWIATDAQDFPRAIGLFSDLCGRGDIHAQALGHTGLGWVWLAQHRLDLADRSFDAALTLGVRASDARYGKLVTFLRRSETLDRGSPERRRILNDATDLVEHLLTGPHSERTHTIAGHIAFQAGKYDQAREHFEYSIRHHAVQGAYASLGLVLLRLGRIDEALNTMDEGLARNPDRHAILAALGTAHLHGYHDGASARADKDEGLSYIKRALEQEPTDAVAVRGFALAALHGDEDLGDATELLELALAAPRHRASNAVRSNLALTLADVLVHRAASEENPRALLAQAARHAANAHRWDKGPETTKAKRVVGELRAWRSASGDPTIDIRRGLVWQRWFGLFISAMSLTGGITFVLAFLLGHPSLRTTGWYGIAVLVALCLVGALGGATITTLTKMKGLGIEMSTEPLAGSARLASLPAADMRPPPTVMVAAEHAPGTWFSHPRFPRLGPAIGPLVTGYYANRDTYYPWRTR